MEDFSCCSLHLQCTAEGCCVAERGLMAEVKEEMEKACSLAKRLPFLSDQKNKYKQLSLF